MSSMQNFEEMKKYYEHLSHFFGFDVFEHNEIVAEHTRGYSYFIRLAKHLEYDPTKNAHQNLEATMKQIEDSLMNSDRVTRVIIPLEKKIENLEAEVEELKKYKTYYELAKGLK